MEGVLAAVVGGWLFASLYLSADDRVEVLAVATDIGRFDVIERSDLRVVTIGRGHRHFVDPRHHGSGSWSVGSPRPTSLPAGCLSTANCCQKVIGS